MTVIATEDEKAGRAEQLELPLDDCHLISLRYELDLVSPSDFAAVIGVTEQTLAGWRSSAQGPAYTKTGRTVFYRRGDIRLWLKSQTVKPTIGDAIAA